MPSQHFTFDYMFINYRLLSLQITKHRIGISITEHPSKNESQQIIHDLDSIPYLPKEEERGRGQIRTRISRSMFEIKKQMIKAELSTIIDDFNVCGLVVGYPLGETGHPGSACGRVLHLLDYFAGKIINATDVMAYRFLFLIFQLS